MRRAGLLALVGVIGLSCGREDDPVSPPEATRASPLATSVVRAPAGPGATPTAFSQRSIGAASPATASVALLVTRPGSAETAWVLQPAGATTPASPIARLTHLPGGEVRGTLLPGSKTLVAIADMEREGDGSFGAWLIRLDPGATPQKLLDRCVHASRPLVLPDGRVLVQRGIPGPPPDPMATGELRADALHVDLFDLGSSSTRTVHSWTGYTTHLAAALSDEVFLYRVAHGYADLVAVNVETSAVRVLAAKVPAFARDFSLDPSGRRLVYTTRDSDGWLIEQLDIDSGARSVVERVAGMWATPHVWPGGGVLVNDGGGAVVHGGRGVDRPFGAGFDVVSGIASDGSWAVLSHERPGTLPLPFALDLASGKLFPVSVGDGLRAQVAGVLP